MADRYKSGLEHKTATFLTKRGIEFHYEEWELAYDIKIAKGYCKNCTSTTQIYQKRIYTPDFWLPEIWVFIETKGKFTGRDRTKHQAVRKSHPNERIYILFMRDNYLTKKKKKRYSEWCTFNNIEWAVSEKGIPPEEWLK